MADAGRVFTRKKALLWVLLIATALMLLILLRACGDKRNDLSTLEGRCAFLGRLGWEVDPDSEEHKRVLIPDRLEGVLLDYNRMQQQQGYDLNEHLGERCEQYSYRLTNYPDDSQTVLVTLYIQGKRVIAGDIHSTALDGFMHGLKLQ